MQMQEVLEINGMHLDLLQSDIDKDDFPCQRFTVILRIKNISDTKKVFSINSSNTKYISKEYGLVYAYGVYPYQFSLSTGDNLQPDAFVDLKIRFEVVREAHNDDRMEIEFKDLAIIPLIRWDNKWYWVVDGIEDKRKPVELNSNLSREEKKLLKKQLKSKIEHFESIDEKFGLTLQNFSFDIIDRCTLKVFCEVLSANGEVLEEGFNIELAIYDLDNDIVCFKSLPKYDGEFGGFEVFGFGPFSLDMPLENISKIRIYPTR